MILELAILNVKSGEEAAFEVAMADAKSIIASMKGFHRMDVRPCLEHKGQYVLLVEWQTLENHTEGFRGSPDYQEWKKRLHHFYEPFPTVEHYGEPIITA